jgi:hypothetical protein
VFRKCGLVWDLVLPESLPARAELHAVDEAGSLRRAKSAASRPRTELRQVAELCAAANPVVLEGPAATFSSAVFRRIAGRRAVFNQNPALQRLTAAIGHPPANGPTRAMRNGSSPQPRLDGIRNRDVPTRSGLRKPARIVRDGLSLRGSGPNISQVLDSKNITHRL